MGYEPHRGQSLLHFPKKKSSRFFVIVCGRGYGKTFASAKEASFIAGLPNKNDVVKCSEKDQYVRFKWGSTIEGLSADNPDSLVGDEYDLVILDEAAKMKQDIWDMYISPAVG